MLMNGVPELTADEILDSNERQLQSMDRAQEYATWLRDLYCCDVSVIMVWPDGERHVVEAMRKDQSE